MPEKKTEDMKKYQSEYRKTHPKNKEATNEYMKNYIKKSEDVDCPICGGHFKTYAKYRHDATQKHMKALVEIKDKEEKAELKRKEEEAQQKALAEAEAAKKKPTPAPRKKREDGGHPREPPTIKGVPKPPTPAPRKPKEKPAALKALEEYSSSSSSSDEEEEEEKTLEKETFVLQGKRISAEAVSEYIKSHFEASVNPARAADTKTKRQNKDASLWKKVSAELDGKTFKYLGQHFGQIVAGAYDKPTSQADLISLLKRVIMHFSKVPAAVEKNINMLARRLKESHVKKTTWLPENGVNYADLKAHENDDNVWVALLARIYDGSMPPLRIGDWRNGFVGLSKTLNEIDLKRGVMIRRIKKNQEVDTEDIIPLPPSLIKFIKKRKIKGALFDGLSTTEIDNLLKKTYPSKVATPHYFRSYYTVHTLSQLTDVDEIKRQLKIMDHTLKINASYYNKSEMPAYMKLLAGK